MTRVLIVGGGAREHALAWKLRQSPAVTALYVAPGNPGTGTIAENVPIAATDIPALLRFVEERDIDLTVVGPEAPLALGLADALTGRKRRVFGPSAAATRIESSKSFAKEVMRRARIPTAEFVAFDSADDALTYVRRATYRLVVKADGLAAGKGVSICRDVRDAEHAIRALMVEGQLGSAGARVVIEEMLNGPEVSLLALVDGRNVVPLPPAQDHKRLGDGDSGPNTGGMGAYAPTPFATVEETAALTRRLLVPVVETLAAMGTPYRGVLFAGLMLTADGPRVLEYNCRLGDPEAQVLLPLLAEDLLPWLEAVAAGSLPDHFPRASGSAAGVVLAAPGYPESPVVGSPIEGLDVLPDGVLAFHAGTALDDEGRLITAGGRVMTLVGTAPTLPEAVARAYAAPVSFEGMQRRTDIGRQGLRALTAGPQQPTAFLNGSCPKERRSNGTLLGDRESRGRSRVVVLASGDGSNLQALIDAVQAGDLEVEISAVVSDRGDARALSRARGSGVPALHIPAGDRLDPIARHLHEQRLLDAIDPFAPDLIVLAGWMRVLSPHFLSGCPCPLINLHPALLPLDGESLEVPVLRGRHAVRDALSLKLPFTGVSIHLVTPEVDAGPILVREVVPILPDDDEQALYSRIKPVEHRLLIEAVCRALTPTPIGGTHA